MNIKKTINKNRIKLILSTTLWMIIGIFVSKITGIFNIPTVIHTLITVFMAESINISINFDTIIENKYLNKRLKQGKENYIESEKKEKILQKYATKIDIEKNVSRSTIKKEEIIYRQNNIINYEERHEKVLKKKLERKVRSI